jgi:hypothetical protein
MDVIHFLAAGGGAAALTSLAIQVRLHLRDDRDRQFAQAVFRKTGDPEAARRILTSRRTPNSAEARSKPTPPGSEDKPDEVSRPAS